MTVEALADVTNGIPAPREALQLVPEVTLYAPDIPRDTLSFVHASISNAYWQNPDCVTFGDAVIPMLKHLSREDPGGLLRFIRDVQKDLSLTPAHDQPATMWDNVRDYRIDADDCIRATLGRVRDVIDFFDSHHELRENLGLEVLDTLFIINSQSHDRQTADRIADEMTAEIDRRAEAAQDPTGLNAARPRLHLPIYSHEQ